jgi:hypothetical protein
VTDPTPFVQVHKKMWLRRLDNSGALNLMVHATDEMIPHWQAYLCEIKAADPQIIWAEALPVRSLVRTDVMRTANLLLDARLGALVAGDEVSPDIIFTQLGDGMVETRYRDGTATITPGWKPPVDDGDDDA